MMRHLSLARKQAQRAVACVRRNAAALRMPGWLIACAHWAMVALPGLAIREGCWQIRDPAKIGVRAGKVTNKRKVGKHFSLDIGEGTFAWRRDQDTIDAEAAFDGIYIIRTPLRAATSGPNAS